MRINKPTELREMVVEKAKKVHHQKIQSLFDNRLINSYSVDMVGMVCSINFRKDITQRELMEIYYKL